MPVTNWAVLIIQQPRRRLAFQPGQGWLSTVVSALCCRV
jgi:hypothetical protein